MTYINNHTSGLLTKKAEANIYLIEFEKEADLLLNKEFNDNVPSSQHEFPLHIFPGKIQEFILENNRAFMLPIEYYGLPILTIAAGIIGNGFRLTHANTYIVPATIYGALIGHSSSGKTPAIDACLKPILEIEEELNTEYNRNYTEWETECEGIKKGQSRPSEPIRKELILNNATLEAVHHTLSKNPNGVLMIVDELLGWINSMNQYRNGADEQFWLSNWSNQPVKISRVTKSTVYINQPNVSVIGGLQPGLLKQLSTGDKRHNGFLFRILFSFPKNMKRQSPSRIGPSEKIISQYKNFVHSLYEMTQREISNSPSDKKHASVYLTEEATETYLEWVDKVIVYSMNHTDCESTKSVYGKFEQYCLRFALILKILKLNEKKIDGNATIMVENTILKDAIELTEYFLKNSLRVLDIIDDIDPLAELTETKRKTYTALRDTFKTGDGVIIALRNGLPERSFKSFLNDRRFFKRIKRGFYEKKI